MSFDIDGSLEKHAKRKRMFNPIDKHVQYDRDFIETLLPHRGPMLLLDESVAVDMEAQNIEGKRTLHAHDQAFNGHFPGRPIYPGVLQIEMSGQLGLCLGVLLLREMENNPQAAFDIRLWKVHKALFCSEIKAGDEVSVLASVLEDTGSTLACAGQLIVNGEVASFSIVEAVIV